MTTDLADFTIEMTGTADYQRNIKMLLAGYPGTGKTLFSSTAPSPFFIFFQEQPRIMSIAERYVPHTKVLNQYDAKGRLRVPVWETLLKVVDYLESKKGELYKTVVVDTGDELFQAMKKGKKDQNRGSWNIQDWGWIGDMYREVVNRIIDLNKHVIVTYHLKQSQEGDDGEVFREVALQGQAKDEVAGWFDIVGVIDSWEERTEKGLVIPHRGIKVQTTPRYPFVKDHSGKLGGLFELSDNFVGDFPRLEKAVYADVPTTEHEVLEIVAVEEATQEEPAKVSSETGVPSPEELDAKKGVTAKKPAKKAPAKKAPAKKAPAKKKEEEPVEEVADQEDTGQDLDSEGPAVSATTGADEKGDTEEGGNSEPETVETEGEAEEVTTEEALNNVEEAFPDSQVVAATCAVELDDGEVCGNPLVKDKTDLKGNKIADSNGEPIIVPDTDLVDLSMIRFRKHMCRTHFQQAREQQKKEG